MASSALVLLLHVGHCQALLLPEKAWCLVIASIAEPYLRAVTRQVLQNRCPHGVESTSFQEGNPLRGSRQIGHWRGSSDILKVSSFNVFHKDSMLNEVVKNPDILGSGWLKGGRGVGSPLWLGHTGCFFDCSALKMSKCQPDREISELFLPEKRLRMKKV